MRALSRGRMRPDNATAMANTDRLYKIESMIRLKGCVSFRELREALEVSPATLKRDLEYLRSRLGAPIEYDASANGYRFGAGYRGQRHELPGLWFSERELYSLLMSQQLLGELDEGGLLSRHLAPLIDRIHQLLGSGDRSRAEALLQRVKVVSALRRPVAREFFETVGEALTTRRRLSLRYLTRRRREVGLREVSPQRLVHYRSTWYLDAWCHRAEALRRFALDAMEQAVVRDLPALEVPLDQVREAMDAGYGIFAGGRRRWATLRFTPQAAQWISREEWHAEQQGRWRDDGSYELKLPYVDDNELLMDVMRQGADVQVLEPPELRAELRRRLRAALDSLDEPPAAPAAGVNADARPASSSPAAPA